MVKIGLIHGMSYRDNRIFATKETPEVVVDDMDVAKHYENTGFFKILGEAGTDTTTLSAALENEFPADLFTPPEDKEPESVAEAGTDTEEDDVLTKELNSKTVAELKEYAETGFRGWEFAGGKAVANQEMNRLQLIDTTGLSKKADLVQHIFSEQKKADEARALLRGE